MSHPQLIMSASGMFINGEKQVGKNTSGNQESKSTGSRESKYTGRP